MPGSERDLKARRKRPYLPPLGAPAVAAPVPEQSGPSLADLRVRSAGPRKLSAVSLPALRQSEILLPLEPSLDSRVLKPASFSNVKGLRRRTVAMPRHHLQPLRMVTRAALSCSAARVSAHPAGAAVPAPPTNLPTPVDLGESRDLAEPLSPFAAPSFDRDASSDQAAKLSAPSADPIFKAPEPTVPGPRSAASKSSGEPLWHQLFSPENRAAREAAAVDDAPHYSREIHESGYDWGDAGTIALDGLPESKSNLTALEDDGARKKIWFWQAIEGVFLSRAFSGALAVMMLVLFVGTLEVPWNEWVRRQASRVRNPIAAAVNQLSRPIEERAAFFIADDFSAGLDNWSAVRSIRVDPAGWLRVTEGFTIHEETVNLQDYRLDFDAKIQAQAVGWSVRTRDEDTFYGFKLLQAGSSSSPNYSLQRFSVIDGVKSSVSQRIDVPAHLARSDDFNRISVRVVKDQITTLVNGWGVDFWRDDRIDRGGVGLLADAGEAALVRKMTVSGNDDTWGLILYGTLETMRSVEDFFGASSAPAAVMFYRPPTLRPATFRLAGE